MFRETIVTPIDPIPTEYVRTLNRLYNEPDYSLTCLGIAMLRQRIENYKGIIGTYYRTVNLKEAYDKMIELSDSELHEPALNYFIYREPSDIVIAEYKDLKRKTSIETLIKEKAATDCYVFYSEDRNFASVIINSSDIKLYHLLTSFLSLYFPKIFKDKPLSDDEYNLIRSLSKKDRDVFVENVKKLVAPYAIEFKRLQLSRLLANLHDRRLAGAKNDVDNRRAIADRKRDEYADAIDELRKMIVVYEGMKAVETKTDAEDELVEYLATNEAIHNVVVDNAKISFGVTTELVNANEDTWKVFSDRGYIYDGEYRIVLPDVFKVRENRKLLLDNIFGENAPLTVKMRGNYSLNLDNGRVTTYAGYSYNDVDPQFKSYLSNPHLQIFECLGGYRERIPEVILQRNYIPAIEMCIISAGSINLDEVDQTFRPFIGWILTSTEKVLKRKKDGIEMTPEEALIWLTDKEKDNETVEAE